MPYSYLHLPAIPKVKKLPTILSREEIWRMLQSTAGNVGNSMLCNPI
ncbi:hypothetical protein ACFOY3_02885 [Kaistella carnis]|nr:hypothetical protein [Kaistella carnis]